ncbi:MAG: vWA domain-containing protein, partial [Planctomycetota bacterium]
MRFLHASQLLWLSLLAVPVVLYLFRRKPREVRVSTLLFFKTLARELVVSPPAGALKSVVILVDRSASMAARDEHGRTRLEDAIASVREKFAGLPGGTSVSVMAYDRRPEILLPPSIDQREVDRALASITVRPMEGKPAAALALAGRLAALETPAAVWHASDFATEVTESTEEEEETDAVAASSSESSVTSVANAVVVEHITAALADPVNAGLTAFRLRRLPLEQGKLEAFVQVHCTAEEEREVRVEMRLDGTLVEERRISIKPGGRERLLVPIRAGEGEAFSLRVLCEGDCLEVDDEVHAFIPELEPLRVVWVSPDPD